MNAAASLQCRFLKNKIENIWSSKLESNKSRTQHHNAEVQQLCVLHCLTKFYSVAFGWLHLAYILVLHSTAIVGSAKPIQLTATFEQTGVFHALLNSQRKRDHFAMFQGRSSSIMRNVFLGFDFQRLC